MRTKASIEREIEKLRADRTALFHGDNPNKWRMMDIIQEKTISLWASWHRIDENKTVSVIKHGGAPECLAEIQSYLGNGGLFNPEAMEHDKVRELILECRACITSQQDLIAWIASQENLFFAECSQAEEIVARCKAAL